MTPNRQDEEILAPVGDVFELLIVEPEGSEKEGPFMISVPSNAVGARLCASINQYTMAIQMGGHMVYDGSIIQDSVPLARGYEIQDQCDIYIYPRGDLPATFRNPDFHSLRASSSDVRAVEEPPQGVRETTYREVILDSGAAQPLFADEEGTYRYADGAEPTGREADPSGQLMLPSPLGAGGPAEPPSATAMPVLDPVSPAKATVGNAPVVATRTNVYQAPPKTSVTSQKLLPTAKATPRAAVYAGGPDDPDQPTCKRKGCDHSPWNGEAGF